MRIILLILFLIVNISVQAQEERLGIGECVLGDNTTIADATSIALIKSKADAINSFGVYIYVESRLISSEVSNQDDYSETIKSISGGVVKEKSNTKKVDILSENNITKVKVSATYIFDKKEFDSAIDRYIDEKKLDKQHKRYLAIEHEKTLQLIEKNKLKSKKNIPVETKYVYSNNKNKPDNTSSFLYIADKFTFIGIGAFRDYKNNMGLSGQFVLNVLSIEAGYWSNETEQRVSNFMLGVPLKIRNSKLFVIPKIGMYSIKEQNMKAAHALDLGIEFKIDMVITQLGLHVGLYQASLFLTFGG